MSLVAKVIKVTWSRLLFRWFFGVWPEEGNLIQRVVDEQMATLAWTLWNARVAERHIARKYISELPVKVDRRDIREQRRRQRQVASCKDRLLNAQHYAEFFNFTVKDPADYVLDDIEDLAGEVAATAARSTGNKNRRAA